MPFVQAKCENCGAILTVDSDLKAAICSHCGSAYVVQDSINYYNSVTQVEHLHAGVVNISDESSAEGRLKAAEAYMKLKKYEQAADEYNKVTSLTPQDYRGWYGSLEACSYEYSKRLVLKSEFKHLEDCANSVEVFAPPGLGEQLLAKYKDYIESEKAKNSEEKMVLKHHINELNDKMDELDSHERYYKGLLSDAESRQRYAASHMFNPQTKNRDMSYYTIGCVSSFIIGMISIALTQDYAAIGVLSALFFFGVFALLVRSMLNRGKCAGDYRTLGNKQIEYKKQIDLLITQKENVKKELIRTEEKLEEIL